MFKNIFSRKIKETQSLFRDHFIDVKTFYAIKFDRVPCVTFIGELDTTKALAYIRERYDHETISFLQHSFYDHAEGKMFFNNTVLVLNGNRIVEVASNYCQVLHSADQYNWAIKLVKELAVFKTQQVAYTPATVVGFARQTALN